MGIPSLRCHGHGLLTSFNAACVVRFASFVCLGQILQAATIVFLITHARVFCLTNFYVASNVRALVPLYVASDVWPLTRKNLEPNPRNGLLLPLLACC